MKRIGILFVLALCLLALTVPAANAHYGAGFSRFAVVVPTVSQAYVGAYFAPPAAAFYAPPAAYYQPPQAAFYGAPAAPCNGYAAGYQAAPYYGAGYVSGSYGSPVVVLERSRFFRGTGTYTPPATTTGTTTGTYTAPAPAAAAAKK